MNRRQFNASLAGAGLAAAASYGVLHFFLP